MIETDHKPILFFEILVLVFFCNHMLPFGLTITLILSPFFLFSLLRWKRPDLFMFSAIGLFLINVPHLILGVDIKTWLISNVNLFSVILFTCIGVMLARANTIQHKHIERLSIINVIGVVIAIITVFLPGIRHWLWYEIPFTPNHAIIPRLKLLTLEASHYALLIVPLFMYYLLRVLKASKRKDIILLITLAASLILSFSLGVLFVLGFSFFVFLLAYLRLLLKHRAARTYIFSGGFILVLAGLGLYWFYPDNPLFFRIENVLTGVDTSGRGRTYEAFDIASQVLEETNTWFGVGVGQFKLVGRETLIGYYRYMNIPDVVRLPNAMAETLVTFGWLGFVGKLLLQWILFFKTQVYKNLLQCALFLFVFIYQFTGSYLVNTTEYMLWILAFVPIFPMFSTQKFFKV